MYFEKIKYAHNSVKSINSGSSSSHTFESSGKRKSSNDYVVNSNYSDFTSKRSSGLKHKRVTSIDQYCTPRNKSDTITDNDFTTGPKLWSEVFTPHSSAFSRSSFNKICSTTTPSSSTLSSTFVAIIEGRGNARGEIGLAWYDLKCPTLELCQFIDGQSYSRIIAKINVLNPVEILMPNTICEADNKSVLIQQVTAYCNSFKIISLNRKYFNDHNGLEYVKSLSNAESSVIDSQISSKYYCLAATSALLKYIEFTQNIAFAPSSMKILFKVDEQITMIDFSTAKNLELIKGSFDIKSRYSLYEVLNNVKTHMGSKLLRSNILQPPCDLQTIESRLDMVEELLNNCTMFHKIRNGVGHFRDLDHILSLIIQIPNTSTIRVAEAKLTILISLKTMLEAVEFLKDALEDSLLDVSRKMYSETIEDIHQLVDQLGKKFNMDIRSCYGASRGFYLKTPANKPLEDLPKDFLKPVKSNGFITFTNYEMLSLNDRIKLTLDEIYMLSGRIADDLLKELRKNMPSFYKLAECVGVLDMVSCFASNSIISNFNHARPIFTQTLAVKKGYHPALEKLPYCNAKYNPIFASAEYNFVIISGPNMSGKSTYLRQIAVLQIMAQIGSYVPAEAASFRICNHIFSRIGINNDRSIDISVLHDELKEIKYIVQNVDDSSLIIIDELCRGTSANEGVSICLAFCEYVKNFKAFCFFATHHEDITSLEDMYPNIENYHFDDRINMNDDNPEFIESIDYSHQLVRGRCTVKHYGIRLAEVSGFKSDIIANAKEFALKISQYKQKFHPKKVEDNFKREIGKELAKIITETEDFDVLKQLLISKINSSMQNERALLNLNKA